MKNIKLLQIAFFAPIVLFIFLFIMYFFSSDNIKILYLLAVPAVFLIYLLTRAIVFGNVNFSQYQELLLNPQSKTQRFFSKIQALELIVISSLCGWLIALSGI